MSLTGDEPCTRCAHPLAQHGDDWCDGAWTCDCDGFHEEEENIR